MIVCLGTTPVLQRSMVFERLRVDEVNRAASVHDYASGKSINVARVLRARGEEVFATGFAGGDRCAPLLRDVEAAGIRNYFVTVDAPTRQCVTVIDRAAGTATELVEESRPVAEGDWARLDEILAALLEDAEGLVLSGSLPPGAPQDYYLRCLRRMDPRRTRAVVDARGEPLRHALRHGGFVAKLNREELGATVGQALETDEAVRRAIGAVTPAGGAAVVTLGRDGAIAAAGGEAWRVRVPPVQARSAVGSGDAFSAGLILGLVRGQTLPDACAFGAACGAANAMTDLAGHLNPAHIDLIKEGVTVERCQSL